VYALIAIVAFLATMTQNIAFMAMPDNGGVIGFVRSGYANPAAASLSNDLYAFAIAGCIFMVVEGRRLRMRWLPAYVVIALVLAISVAFPLFLIAREIRLAGQSAPRRPDLS
jgi:hypothetical protein